MIRFRVPVFATLFVACAAAIVPHLAAQEPDAAAPPVGGRGGGRGAGGAGRGGGRGNTREFLGLGQAPDPAAAAKGAPLFKQNCAGCHGDNARGAQAPSLVRSVVVLHDENDESIGPVVKSGRPQAGMPAFGALSQDDIHNIDQYIKQQIEMAANRGTYGQTYGSLRNQVTGDPQKGAAFFQANCVSCHSLTGDLAKIGAKYPQPSQLQTRFLWPTPAGPKVVTVTTSNGEKVTGTIRQISDFDVTMYDTAGNHYSWKREAVKLPAEDPMAAHRALLPKYSNADMHNLTAYLATIK